MDKENKKRRVGRPSLDKENQQKARRKIILTAKSLFKEHGIESVSMRKIAAKAGFSQRLPYLHFKNKQAILRHIWEDFFIVLFDHCHKAIESVDEPHDRLEAFLRAYANYWFEHEDQYELVFLNKDKISDPADQYYVEEFCIVDRYEFLNGLVQDCMDNGTIKKGDPALYSQVLMCSLQGILHCLITIGEYPWNSRDDIIETNLELLFDGLRPKDN